MKQDKFRLLVREMIKQELPTEAARIPVDLTQDPVKLGGGKPRLGKFVQDNYQKLLALSDNPDETFKFLEDSKPNISVSDEHWTNKFIKPLQDYISIPAQKKRFIKVAKFYTDVILSAAGMGMSTLKESENIISGSTFKMLINESYQKSYIKMLNKTNNKNRYISNHLDELNNDISNLINEYNQLNEQVSRIDEGLSDIINAAKQKMQDISQNILDKVQQFFSFVMSILNQVDTITIDIFIKISNGISNIGKFIGTFKSKYPVWYKIIKFGSLALVVVVLAAVFSDTAQAAQGTGGKPLDLAKLSRTKEALELMQQVNGDNKDAVKAISKAKWVVDYLQQHAAGGGSADTASVYSAIPSFKDDPQFAAQVKGMVQQSMSIIDGLERDAATDSSAQSMLKLIDTAIQQAGMKIK